MHKQAGGEKLAGVFSDLAGALSCEKAALDDLIVISRGERDAVAQNAVGELSRLTAAKEETVGRMDRLERRRSDGALALADELGISVEGATISMIAERLPFAMATALRALQKEIETDVVMLKDLTTRNALLLEACLGAIKTSLFVVTRLMSVDSGYSSDGRLKLSSNVEKAAIDRRA